MVPPALHEPDDRAAIPPAWAAGVMAMVVFALLVMIPLVGRATVCVDDFAWVKLAHATPSLWQSLGQAWTSYLFFRPLDIVVNWFIDPVDLGSAAMLPFQATGLLLLLAAVWRLTRVIAPHGLLAPLAASIWLMLHTATQTSFWAAGATSQTWCAAIGMWLICQVLLMDGERGLTARDVAQSLALSTAGVVSKELFVGWASAAALIVVARLWQRAKALKPLRLAATGLAITAILAPPALWIAIRMATSEFGRFAEPSADLHYSFQGPRTIVWNAALSTLGMFAQGPVHWARLRAAPWNLVPFAGAALSFGLAAYGGSPGGRGEGPGWSRNLLPAAVGLGLVAVWPALPIRQVSELYIMGPNALIAVLVGAGVGRIMQPNPALAGSGTWKSWQRAWLRGAVACLAAIAVIGFGSRTYHFAITWEYARALRGAARALVEREPADGPLTIVVDGGLEQGPVHSKYLVPPTWAADLPNSFRTFRLGGVDLPPVTFRAKAAPAAPGEKAVRLECRLPSREIW
jgi:hypothetical protein